MPNLSPSQSASWSTAEIGLAFGSILLITFVAFEELAATTIMPTVVSDLGATSWYPIASGAALATQLSATVVAGAWADRRGPRFVLFAGLAFFATGLLVSAAAPVIILFVLGRALQGLGGGLLIVPLYVLVGKIAPSHHRPAFFAWFSLAWVLPSLVGPAIAGHVTQMWGWRYVFGAVPLFFALSAVPVALVLRRIPQTQPRLIPGMRTLSRNAAIAGLGVMTLQLAGALPSLIERLTLLLVGSALTAWTLPRLLPRGTFRCQPGMPAAVLARMSALATHVGIAVMIPLVLQRVHGWDEASAAWWVTIGALTWAAGSLAQARVAAPRTRRVLPVVGGTLMAVGVLPLGALLLADAPLWIALSGWLMVGLGIGLVHAPLSVMALEVTPEHKHGRVSSWLQVADSAGPALELALVSVAMSVWATRAASAGTTYAPYWLIATILASVTVVAVLRLRPTKRHHKTQSS